jgi:hypothetical protein
VVNDEQRAIEGATCEAYLRAQGKDVRVGGRKEIATIPADSVADVGWLEFTVPAELAAGAYDLVLVLKQGERVLSENSYPVTVVE